MIALRVPEFTSKQVAVLGVLTHLSRADLANGLLAAGVPSSQTDRLPWPGLFSMFLRVYAEQPVEGVDDARRGAEALEAWMSKRGILRAARAAERQG